MRIFYAFLVMMTMAILVMLPLSDAVHDFRTDTREDSFSVATGVSENSTSVVLVKPLYDGDVSTATVLSDDSTDTPLASYYNNDTRALTIEGLSTNTTRTLEVSYEVDALSGSSAIDDLVSNLDLIWLICLVAFPAAALAAIFLGRV